MFPSLPYRQFQWARCFQQGMRDAQMHHAQMQVFHGAAVQVVQDAEAQNAVDQVMWRIHRAELAWERILALCQQNHFLIRKRRHMRHVRAFKAWASVLAFCIENHFQIQKLRRTSKMHHLQFWLGQMGYDSVPRSKERMLARPPGTRMLARPQAPPPPPSPPAGFSLSDSGREQSPSPPLSKSDREQVLSLLRFLHERQVLNNWKRLSQFFLVSRFSESAREPRASGLNGVQSVPGSGREPCASGPHKGNFYSQAISLQRQRPMRGEPRVSGLNLWP